MVRRTDARRLALTLSLLLPIGAGIVATSGPSSADITAVKGSAFGYFSRISLFGGPPGDRPCTNPPTNTIGCAPAPAVTLPPGGSATPITATAPSGDARYGPGIFFTSGPITVTTQGTTGPTGSVTSTADITTTNTSGAEVFTAAKVTSTCTAGASLSGSTTITGGTLQTDDGDANNPVVVVPVPVNPPPNTTFTGRLRSVGDSFRYIFNEQIINPDGSITVNAGHQIAIGPTAVGDLYFGQVVCGVTGTQAPPTTTTVAPTTTTSSTTTTLPATTTTTTMVPGTTTTIVRPTTTTLGGTGDTCAQLQKLQTDLDNQIAAIRAAVLPSLPPEQRAAVGAQLDATQAQARALIAQASAATGCAPLPT